MNKSKSYKKMLEDKKNLSLGYRVIKIINIFYVGIMYMIIGGALSIFINHMYPNIDEEKYKKKNIVKFGIEFICLSALLFVMCYIVRNIVRLLGSPLDGYYNFDYQRLKELNGGVVLSLSLICFSTKLFIMARIFSERIVKVFN